MAFRPHPFPVSAPALLPLLAALCTCTACGLIDDAREEQSRYEYIVFSDKPFETYCLETWDLNGDGRISRYEAQRVRRIAAGDQTLWQPHATRLTYALPRSFYITVSYRF